MAKFRRCMEQNDLSALIVDGEPTTEQLAEAWATLFFEYCDLAEQAEASYRVRLECQIKLFRIKHETCFAWIQIIELIDSPQIAAALRVVGYDFGFHKFGTPEYQHDIASVKAELSALRFDIRIKEAEYSAIEKTPAVNDTIDAKYFSTIYTRINNYCKYNAVNDQTTVEMYCAALRDFVGAVEESKKPTNG